MAPARSMFVAMFVALVSCALATVSEKSENCAATPLNAMETTELTGLLQVNVLAGATEEDQASPKAGQHPFSLASPSVTKLASQAGPLSQMNIPVESTHVLINVGPNKDPVPNEAGAFRLLVEPLPSVVSFLRRTTRDTNTVVLQSAISNFTGTAEFNEYNTDGVSSSLSSSADDHLGDKKNTYTVAVHTLKELLDAIPVQKPISYLKTDMQGYDLTAIKSAGSEIRRVHRIHAEVYEDGFQSYAGVENELHRHWLPYMQQIGFRQDGKCTWNYVNKKMGASEMNCDFVPIVANP